MNRSHQLPLLVAVLLVGSAVLFAAGTAIEHSQRATHHETHAEAAKSTSGETSNETGKTEPSPTTTTAETHSERIAGIDPESWLLVSLAIALSAIVAAGAYWRRGRWLVAAAVFGLVFAAADTRELIHQLNESRPAVAAIAGALIALHLLVTVLAATAVVRPAAPMSEPLPRI
jgi:hypothetical protein